MSELAADRRPRLARPPARWLARVIGVPVLIGTPAIVSAQAMRSILARFGFQPQPCECSVIPSGAARLPGGFEGHS